MSFALAIALFGKATMLLGAGLLCDQLLRRKWVLETAAVWNAVYVGLAALLPATLVMPTTMLPILPSLNETTSLLELTTASNGRADVIHRFAEPC